MQLCFALYEAVYEAYSGSKYGFAVKKIELGFV